MEYQFRWSVGHFFYCQDFIASSLKNDKGALTDFEWVEKISQFN